MWKIFYGNSAHSNNIAFIFRQSGAKAIADGIARGGGQVGQPDVV